MLIKEPRGRIQFLDGLRCIAVMMVILFHYCVRWTVPIEPVNLYPYGDRLVHVPVAAYGHLGVQLFFIISGFVIALTLTRSGTLSEFAVRRFARLWPTMLLCSVVTYATVSLIPQSPFHVSPFNFLPSLTFIVPDAFNFLSRSSRFDWMDGAYWSLFVEVRFYALMGLLYFMDRDRFARNLSRVAAVALAAYAIALFVGSARAAAGLKALLITQHLPWFLFGVGFYFKHVRKPQPVFFWLAGLGLLSQLLTRGDADLAGSAVAAVVFPLMVWAGMSTNLGNRVLSLRWLAGIGTASYSLYLLHQRIGVALMHWVADVATGSWTIVFAPLVAALVTATAIIIYRFWETPWNARLVSAVLGGTPRLVTAPPQKP